MKDAAATSTGAHLDVYDWKDLGAQLDGTGCAVLPSLLSADECTRISALYTDESHFRSHVGDHWFPLQAAILLAEPGKDFTGGEFVLTEQRPRMQSRVEVVPLRQGDAVVFAVNNRPVRGSKGTYRVKLRHGVSRLRSGERHTLGIIFHDAT